MKVYIITEAFSRSFTSIIVFLDFEKVLEKVPQKGLILKLKAHGFDELLLVWLTDFLTHRKQQVVLGPHSSTEQKVTSGVPQ